MNVCYAFYGWELSTATLDGGKSRGLVVQRKTANGRLRRYGIRIAKDASLVAAFASLKKWIREEEPRIPFA